MSDTSTHSTETTTERKPPTLADIVREKTDDGKRIIDFFLDVMEDRIDGAELCHRIDAAKQLEKHKSKAAARFLAEYRGVSCGHSINGRPDPADPCAAEERSLVAVTLNAPATLTRDFLTVLSGIDEFLMARLIRAQTADAGTIIDFLDDVMQDRNDGFKTHHRIAAAKELIVHIVRDEQPEPTPREPVPEQSGIPAESLPRTRYGAGTQGGGGGRRTAANPARTEPVLSTVEGSAHPEPRQIVIPAESLPRTRYGAGTHPTDPVLSTVAGSVHPEPGSPEPVEQVEGPELVAGSVHPEPVEGSELVAGSVHPEPGSPEPVERVEGPELVAGSVHPESAEGSQLETLPARRPQTRRTRTQRRRDGAARAATLGKHPGSQRNEEEKQDKPARVELTPAERRIKERLERHWHEPDPWAAPIDSTNTGRSPPQ